MGCVLFLQYTFSRDFSPQCSLRMRTGHLIEITVWTILRGESVLGKCCRRNHTIPPPKNNITFDFLSSFCQPMPGKYIFIKKNVQLFCFSKKFQ